MDDAINVYVLTIVVGGILLSGAIATLRYFYDPVRRALHAERQRAAAYEETIERINKRTFELQVERDNAAAEAETREEEITRLKQSIVVLLFGAGERES